MNKQERVKAAPVPWVEILKKNYAQVIFVFIAFFLVSLVSVFSHRSLTKRNLRNAAAESLRTLEANIRASLHEPEATLISSAFTIQNMILDGASNEDVLAYLTGMTEWLMAQGERVSGFNGMYGFVRNEYMDGTDWVPGADYVPAERPWYKAAKENPGQIASTPPYVDADSGEVVVSFAQELYDASGASLGVIALDVLLTKVSEDIKGLMQSYGGYGVLHDGGLRIMAHPRAEFLDMPLASVSPRFARIARELAAGREVMGAETQNAGGRRMIAFYYRLYNGWYVGMLIPKEAYYGDLYRSDMVQIILAAVLALALAYILLRLSAAKLKADVESRQKSSFLANMSHEIRTPMNAIVGMSELLLRGNLGEDERGYANDIKQAGNNLISIINDILDFSKIEAGKLEIIPGNYLLPSLVNDVVSVIRMKLVDRPIRFYTNIDAYLPNGLEGDEVRVRQILLNLLSNAAKYTERGCVSMTITAAAEADGVQAEAERVCLKVVVSDTGIGIKPEDQKKLFGEFVQVDTAKNQGVEGTGLGLAITRRLCEAMGGSISVESEYGKGSVFTAFIPQGADFSSPFAAVEEPETKKVLVYEGRLNYARSVCWSLSNMKVPHTMVTSQDAFTEALFREEWYFIFSGYGLYPQIKPLMEKEEAAFFGGKKPPLALMVEWGTEAFVPGVRFVALPVQALSIANILNGRPDRGYMEAAGGFTHARFIIPEARLLIVDDIATNLKVAEGLIAPYQAKVDACLSGAEAVELIKWNYAQGQSYDIVFMDHMMPGMDGIEAAALIRAIEGDYFKTVPIIALTANAVSGMREMFLSRGFSGFISKPIDVSKLDETLTRWIPRPKLKKSDISTPLKPPVKGRTIGFSIPGLDTAKGIAATGGALAGYKQVLAIFCQDAEDRLPLLAAPPEQTALPLFTTQVHALKSVAASIGAAELAAEAAALEAAGKAGDMAAIQAALPEFYARLKRTADAIEAALDASGVMEAENQSAHQPLAAEFRRQFETLQHALEHKDLVVVDRLLAKLETTETDAETRKTIEQISNAVLMTEFETALTITSAFLKKEYIQNGK
jgi:signal transduction histidine kinase/HPt (histidine-containing phosphotransfer) domain-containing protein